MIKRTFALLAVLALVALACGTAGAAAAVEYYVAPDGSDANPGTLAQPFLTIGRAQTAVRAKTAAMTSDVVVNLRGGAYRLDAPLELSDAAGDSGENGHRVIYQAYGYGTPAQELPVLSGGRTIAGWTLVDAGQNIWRAPVGEFSTRQLYREGLPLERGSIAKLPGKVTITKTGYTTTSTAPQSWANPAGIELEMTTGNYSAAICGVKSITGTAAGSTITMDQPCFGWYSAVYSYNEEEPETPKELLDPAPVSNSRSFLAKAETWAFDESTAGQHYLYYRARPGEDPNAVSFAAPRLQTLVRGTGTKAAPIHDLSFRGLGFDYSTWLRPSNSRGLVGIFGDAYYDGGSPSGSLTEPTTRELSFPAAVEFAWGKDLVFEGDRFQRLGGDALAVVGSSGGVVRGNFVARIAGGGVRLEGREGLSSGNLVEDNWVHRVGLDYRGGPGVFLDAMQQATISHNQVNRTSYSGIILTNVEGDGRGNQILANRVFGNVRDLPDGGGIYTAGAEGTSYANGATIEANVVDDVINPFIEEIDPKGEIGTPNALYTDIGADFITLRRNVVFHNHQSWGGVLPGRMKFTDSFWDDDQLVFYGSTAQLQISGNTLLPVKGAQAACEGIAKCDAILEAAGPTAPWREQLGLPAE